MKKLRLQGRHDKATSKKGRDRVLKILNAARDLIIDEGFHRLSMRRVAERSKMTVGNLSYYYSSKSDLLHDLVESVLQGYEDDWDRFLVDEHLSAEEKLASIITAIIEDLATVETTRFFPELWVMATHDPVVKECMIDVYSQVRLIIARLIQEVNPALDETSCYALALFIVSSIEGHTVFIGDDKSCTHLAPHILKVAVPTFLSLVKNATNDSVQPLSA
ncbi:hypothetical protein GCM10017044_00700 [Kordiimonas sediminis]|uniref:HTH tetR-type domain-containing protein n=1 Tax=Kordiimonas sediminis TaxID=1735581 RepID=A0A919AIU2_9PROT|nr:TetR/AcrR family transcriptional regulator [Kordiimonas sediminis]GHF10879.1 hypothetical protein GCM10017044_00700 [Kordiimonas sediminis]